MHRSLGHLVRGITLAAVALAWTGEAGSLAKAREFAPYQLVNVQHVSGPQGGFSGRYVKTASYKQVPCCDPCLPPIKQRLTFCHPCTGCKVSVDVCIPGECTDCPLVTCRNTLFGSGLVRYDWCCGYSVIIRFTAHGGVRVIYR